MQRKRFLSSDSRLGSSPETTFGEGLHVVSPRVSSGYTDGRDLTGGVVLKSMKFGDHLLSECDGAPYPYAASRAVCHVLEVLKQRGHELVHVGLVNPKSTRRGGALASWVADSAWRSSTCCFCFCQAMNLFRLSSRERLGSSWKVSDSSMVASRGIGAAPRTRGHQVPQSQSNEEIA
ncbi:hypothetical protein HPB50_023964 [Hyalomma asiaticum]|uniref:Uncharacterized protein n=1 Tax=Hyalomma asiaticum TaxID=266040 RepID=A0ACB7S3V3_HYAAI|nr:hypothetical protein HPB50_023964 [Hyalomma asiaticum]